jgi:hypothetical protein
VAALLPQGARDSVFSLDRSIRRIALEPAILQRLPPEAMALELRAMLDRCPSPGRVACSSCTKRDCSK